MAEVVAATVIGGLLSAGSSAYQASEQREIARDARKEEKELQAKQKAIQANQAAKERRRQVALARTEQARLQASAQASGVAGSSAEAGAVSATASKAGTNIFDVNTSLSNTDSLLQSQNALNKALTKTPGAGTAFATGLAGNFGNALFTQGVATGTESLFKPKG